ncbi:hypothetical protein ACJZTR_00835 [Neorickettsia risticii]|uniref:Uncharacterized protein n=1 Tax=Neorickettsia risticii (strain Illinois) TaxID=434131 RepID=C6V474_NEORI|nr:hypothetical protein [Neorickettsia risticii]ACT69180.1 conserved hypothetical protein [Neorickettsia risticii str. Illinois]
MFDFTRVLYLKFIGKFTFSFVCFLLFLVPALAVPRIGIFSTDLYVYEREAFGVEKFFKLPEALGHDFEVVMVDYNLIHSDYLKKNKKVPLEKVLENALEVKGVKHLILPGDVYNVHMSPLHPTSTKGHMYKALLGLVKENKVSIFGICGGMQQFFNADGIRILNLLQMGIAEPHKKQKDPNSASTPSPYPDRLIRKVMVNPASKVGAIISQVPLEVTANGWLILYVPELHSEGVALDKDNLKTLRDSGYNVVGFAEDGVIEIVEDRHGNFYFQPHIESFLLEFTPEKISELPEKLLSSVDAAKYLLLHFIGS